MITFDLFLHFFWPLYPPPNRKPLFVLFSPKLDMTSFPESYNLSSLKTSGLTLFLTLQRTESESLPFLDGDMENTISDPSTNMRWKSVEGLHYLVFDCCWFSFFCFYPNAEWEWGRKKTYRSSTESEKQKSQLDVTHGLHLAFREAKFPKSLKPSRYICQLQPPLCHRKPGNPCKYRPVPHGFRLRWVNPLRH